MLRLRVAAAVALVAGRAVRSRRRAAYLSVWISSCASGSSCAETSMSMVTFMVAGPPRRLTQSGVGGWR